MITLEKIKKSDKKLGVQSIQRKQYCEEHDDEVLKLFCKTCKKVICRDCALVKHREHDYSFIREVRPETRNQLELLLKKVEEKENEFHGHKKHVEGLQRSNEDTLNFCLKDVNEMCDKLIEVIESRRAFLVAELHSKHEAEEEQNKGEMNSIDLSLVRLSDSIRFTRKLLDDGNDVELMTVGMQAKEALEGLSTMEWNRDAVRPSLLRLKFAPAVEDMKSFGKVLSTIQPSDILIKNVPQNVCVGDKFEFSVKLSDEIATRQYDATTLLSVTVMRKKRKIPVAIQKNGLNNWNVSCTPQDGGEHTVNVKLGQFALQSCKLPVVFPSPAAGEGSPESQAMSSTECDNLSTQQKKSGRAVSKPGAGVSSYGAANSSRVAHSICGSVNIHPTRATVVGASSKRSSHTTAGYDYGGDCGKPSSISFDVSVDSNSPPKMHSYASACSSRVAGDGTGDSVTIHPLATMGASSKRSTHTTAGYDYGGDCQGESGTMSSASRAGSSAVKSSPSSRGATSSKKLSNRLY
jgi:hypothetical protein